MAEPMSGRVQAHGFVSQTSNACLCGLMLADCEVASRDAYKPPTSGRVRTPDEDQARLDNHYGYCTLPPNHDGPCALGRVQARSTEEDEAMSDHNKCLVEGCDGEGGWDVHGKAAAPDGSLVDVAGKVCDNHHRQISPPVRGFSLAPKVEP